MSGVCQSISSSMVLSSLALGPLSPSFSERNALPGWSIQRLIISFALGMILGIPNQLTTKFFLLALKEIPAAISYPFFAGSVALLCVLSDIVIWKKKFGVVQKFSLALLTIGIILLNI